MGSQSQTFSRPSRRCDIEIAIICAKQLEADAVFASLDEVYDEETRHNLGISAGDNHTYDYGRCGTHDVVIVTLPRIGKTEAANAATALRMNFGCIKLRLLVGVCGAVPSHGSNDILFGDVVIGDGVVELDFGRQNPWGFTRKKTTKDIHGRPPAEIAGLLERWKGIMHYQKFCRNSRGHLAGIQENIASFGSNADHPGGEEDTVYQPDYVHRHRDGCDECSDPNGHPCDKALQTDCIQLQCDEAMIVRRGQPGFPDMQTPDGTRSFIHFGRIGTADAVMRSGQHRDRLVESEGVIAFEMEGAAVWDDFSCLIIKGVCDYADAHKNKRWQRYAAAVAAAVMKEVLVQYVKHDRPSHPDSSVDYPPTPVHNSLVFKPLPQSTSAREIIDSALSEFQRSITSERFAAFYPTELEGLKRELWKIQSEQENAKRLRNLRRIQGFMEGVAQLSVALGPCLDTAKVVNHIWGSVLFLLNAAKDNATWLDEVLTAYKKLGTKIPDLPEDDRVVRSLWLLDVVALVFRDILEFHQIAMDIFSEWGTLHEAFGSLWKNFSPTCEHIFMQLNAHKRLLDSKVMAITNDSPLQSADLTDIRRHIDQHESERQRLANQEITRQESRYDIVLEWLADTDVKSGLQTRNNTTQFPGSGTWILEQEKVKKWLSPEDSTHSILWINGRPGTGKTYLASMIIEKCKQETSWATGYFYCNRASTTTLVMRGVLSQLLRYRSDLVPYCYERKNSLATGDFTLPKLKPILTTFCRRIPHTYIIIDGVDEIDNDDERSILLTTFEQVMKSCESHVLGKLRVLFLSQPSDQIKNALSSADHYTLSPEDTVKDITNYCRLRAENLSMLRPDEQDAMVQITCERADGMFLFAKLVMDDLDSQVTTDDLRASIMEARFPTNIEEVYDRIMARLERRLRPNQREYAQLLLGWLVRSKRPLKWLEIQGAFTTNLQACSQTGELATGSSLNEDIHKLCGSLVQILDGDRVELVHSTARLYISNQKGAYIDAAECDLAMRCMRYLTLNFFKPGIQDNDLKRHVEQGDFIFQDYAVYTWYMHIKVIVEKGPDLFDRAANLPGHGRRSLQEEIAIELHNFVSFYQADFPADGILDEVRQKCEPMKEYNFYSDLLRIWNHVVIKQGKSYSERNEVSIESLASTLERNRQVTERLSEEGARDLSKHYGKYPYRCPKVLCFFFHEGFRDKKTRDSHVKRHDRPYHCEVEGCSSNGMGFANENALKAHERIFHAEKCVQETFASPHRKRVEKTHWQCPVCSKSFVRNQILKDHLRSHNGERPHQCGECSKAFTRKSDMKRHEKTHDRRR